MLDFLSKAVTVGRPVATSPGVPAERVAALRKAFDLTLRDKDFIAEAAKEGAEIRPMTGEVLAQVVKDLIEAPQSVRERMKTALEPKKDDAVDKAP